MNHPLAPPVNYKLVKTGDESFTLYSEKFDETCHSLSGARKETQYIYIEGCELEKKCLSQKQISILEVGLGLGIGLKETLLFFEQKYPEVKVSFSSLELDEELIFFALKNLEFKKEGHHFSGTIKNFSFNIFAGDARKTLPILNLKNIDAIYQDAFSPKKNPKLWTVEWFELLKISSAPTVILSTYSSSKRIQKSLLKAGWRLSLNEGFGNKKTHTKAFLEGKTSEKLLEKLKNSPSLPLFDKDC